MHRTTWSYGLRGTLIAGVVRKCASDQGARACCRFPDGATGHDGRDGAAEHDGLHMAPLPNNKKYIEAEPLEEVMGLDCRANLRGNDAEQSSSQPGHMLRAVCGYGTSNPHVRR